jgi:hypothetical protein
MNKYYANYTLVTVVINRTPPLIFAAICNQPLDVYLKTEKQFVPIHLAKPSRTTLLA